MFLINFRFVCQLSVIYKFIITGFFLWHLSTLCCALLIMQMELVEFFVIIFDSFSFNELFYSLIFFLCNHQTDHVLNTVELLIISLITFHGFIEIFLYCVLGQMVTDQFENYNQSLGQSNWYLFPIEMQKVYILVMANAQEPSLIRGFGNIECTRETLKKVSKLFENQFYNYRFRSQFGMNHSRPRNFTFEFSHRNVSIFSYFSFLFHIYFC